MPEPTGAGESQGGDDVFVGLADDFLRRHRAGERPTAEQYAGAHPALAGRIRDLFPAMLAMEQPGLADGADLAPPAERVGATVGRYKLLERIGEGGFGVVYMAEQQHPVRRKVALKVIKPGLDTRQVIARFEAERQALAMMDHPNIARVFDAGATDSGRPYFVMELVRGVPITEYCDANHLTTRQRLELFVPVCQAVQHAHTKGVIHRDLKPTNVLVTTADGAAIPKVIDFGVAKATQAPLTDKTLFTEFRQMVGTPAYMSPEQAEMTAVDVDTRSDVYGLGVLLYELLTGTTPFDPKQLRGAACGEIQRIIREVEPPRPSTRLSTLGETLGAVAARRRTDAAKLGRLVRGELDWVVMKCLEKDRARRYATADGLARDVGRYLRDEPVEASPPTAGYRLRKFARRNKRRVAAACVLLAALMAGIAGTTWGIIRAEHARRAAVSAKAAEARRAEGERAAKEEAQKRLAQVEKMTGILTSVVEDLDPMAAERAGVTTRDLMIRRLREAVRHLDEEAAGDPLVVARLQHVLGVSLHEWGQRDQAEEVLSKACRTREKLLGPDHVDTTATRHHLAMVYRDQGKYALAEELYRAVVAIRAARLGARHADTLASQHYLALTFFSQSKHALAEALLKEVLAVRTATLGANHPDTLTTQHRLAVVYRHLYKYDESESLHKEVLAVRTATLGADHLDTIATKSSLAGLYHAQGRSADAEALCTEVMTVRTAKLGRDHPDTLDACRYLAQVYEWRGNFAEAERLLKGVLEVRASRHGADHPDTLNARLDLAAMYRWQGDFAAAEALFKEVLASRTRTLGAGHADALDAQYRLAVLYQARGDLAAAEALLKEVLARRADTLGPNHSDTLETQHALGEVYGAQGRNVLAETLYKQVLARRTAAFGPGHPLTLAVRYDLANLYHWKLRNHELAEPLYVQALATATGLYGAEGATTLDVKLMLAQLYRNRGRFAEAEAAFRDVLEVRTATIGADHADTLYTRFELAILYRWMKKVELAIPWTEQTLELAKATRHPATLRMQAHLGGLYCDSGRFSDAVPLLEEVRRKGAGDGELDWVGDALLTAYLGAGDAERALALATEQARVARERFPADSPELAAALAPPAEALVRLRAYADAEPLLLDAHGGLSQPRAEAAPRADAELRDAISRLVSLYDAWGKPEEAAKWREELARR